MTPPPYTLTNDSVTIVWNNQPYTVRQGAANFVGLRTALLKAMQDGNWEVVEEHLTVGKSLQEWAKGKFTVEGTTIFFEGKSLSSDINERIRSMVARNEDPTPLFKFWERLQQNPSWRSIQQLFPFLKHMGIPFTEDGCFLAYKGVNSDFTDKHSGRFVNQPGAVHEIPRNMVSDDPNTACHVGFHVGARSYATDFASRTVICKVDPKDVVCIPYDEGQRKMRVCKYEVIGHDNGTHLPSTTMSNDIINTPHIVTAQDEEPKCSMCNGEGAILIRSADPDDDYDDDEYQECDNCNGTGHKPKDDDALEQEVSMEPGDGEHEESEDSYSNYNDGEEDEIDPDNKIGEAMDRAFAAGEIDRSGKFTKLVDKLTEEEQELVHNDQIIKAIKSVRERKHCSLKEAKDLVDSFKKGGVTEKKGRNPVKKKYAKIDAMGSAELMNQPLDKLRDYAGKGLAIVGASKIPGGKAALVAKILEVKS